MTATLFDDPDGFARIGNPDKPAEQGRPLPLEAANREAHRAVVIRDRPCPSLREVDQETRRFGGAFPKGPVEAEPSDFLERLSRDSSSRGHSGQDGRIGGKCGAHLLRRRHPLAGCRRFAHRGGVREKLHGRPELERYFEDVPVGVGPDGPSVGIGVWENLPGTGIETEVGLFERREHCFGCHVCGG